MTTVTKPEIAAGDTMILSPTSGRRVIVRVARLTKTQVVVEHGKFFNGEPIIYRFRRDASYMRSIGAGYSGATLHHASPDLIAEVEAEQRHAKAYLAVRDKPLKQLSADQLERIAAILAEGKP